MSEQFNFLNGDKSQELFKVMLESVSQHTQAMKLLQQQVNELSAIVKSQQAQLKDLAEIAGNHNRSFISVADTLEKIGKHVQRHGQT